MTAEVKRLIVRIAGKDLDGRKRIDRALWDIKGVKYSYAKAVAYVFEEQTGIPANEKLGNIPEDKDELLEDILKNPQKYDIPSWLYNRRKDPETGEDLHLLGADLDFAKKKDIEREINIKSYRGLRHMWGLPVRGQKTKRNRHGRPRKTVGVSKKQR